MLTEKDITHIAKLANLDLKEANIPKFQKWLSEVLDYFKLLDSADTSNVEPTFQVTGLTNVYRKDADGIGKQTLPQKDALANAKNQDGRYFTTK